MPKSEVKFLPGFIDQITCMGISFWAWERNTALPDGAQSYANRPGPHHIRPLIV
jgi:hypothetical protein